MPKEIMKPLECLLAHPLVVSDLQKEYQEILRGAVPCDKCGLQGLPVGSFFDPSQECNFEIVVEVVTLG